MERQWQHGHADRDSCAKSFAEANQRLVARLRGASDEAAERPPAGGVVGGADRLARRGRHDAIRGDDFRRDPGGAAARGGLSRAAVGGGCRVDPRSPRGADGGRAAAPSVRRADAVSALEAAGERRWRVALDGLTPERGDRMGITHPIVGTISVYQIGEWATAHVIRHNRRRSGCSAQG